MRSVDVTLDSLPLAELCPRLDVVDGPGVVDLARGEAVLGRWRALVRLHAAVDAVDGRPLRAGGGPRARLLAVAAGAGPVVATTAGVRGLLGATADRPALAYAIAWDEVDDVGPARSGGVRLLATGLLGAVTVDVLGSSLVVD